ncbi:MAG: NAD-dependent epimerase/dehydratase family protein [bacterium]|nr:NAD-dependent epimerase/dehydratase family protein [bacterium]
MRLLITGGSGYIGSRFMARMAARPEVDEIVNLDIRAPLDPHDKVRFVERSVTEDLTDLFTDPERPVDVALHLAWTLQPLRDPRRQREICIGGTRRFLEGCAAGSVKHILYMSSATAYGVDGGPAKQLDESEAPRDHHGFQYAAEKAEGEQICRDFVAAHPGTLLQIVRPAVVGGPNVSNFIFRLLEKPIFFRPLGLDAEMQLVHEDDVAAALVAIVESKAEGAFNLAPDDSLTVSETARIGGARSVALPFGLLYAVSWLAWKLNIRQIIEAPASFLYFVAHPWLVSNRRLTGELDFEFRHGSRETLESYLAVRRAG